MEAIEGEKGERPRVLRKHGEKSLEEAKAENVPGALPEGPNGQGAAERPREDIRRTGGPVEQRGPGISGGGADSPSIRAPSGGKRPTGSGGIQPRLGDTASLPLILSKKAAGDLIDIVAIVAGLSIMVFGQSVQEADPMV